MNVYLHIGHTKTGSSALQSFLAENAGLLAAYGILYKENGSFGRAKKGFITSGNLNPERWDREILQTVKRNETNKDLLFSNEDLMHKIIMKPEKLIALNRAVNLTVILFVRNPVDHMFSAYGQAVKRGGETREMGEWSSEYRLPNQVCRVLETCRTSGVDLKLINYSKVDSVEKAFIPLLLKEESGAFFERAVFREQAVNRSLNRFEYELQRQFNRFYGKSSSRFVSDALVDQIPEVVSEKEYVGREVLEKFVSVNRDKSDCINGFLDEEQRLECTIPETIQSARESYEVTKKQIEVFAGALSSRLGRAENAALRDEDADRLRDIALKYEKKEHLTLEEAACIMEIASMIRPDGPVITQKLQTYRSELKNSTRQ